MSKMPDSRQLIVEDIRSKNMFNKSCTKQNWYLSYSDGKTEIWDSNMAYMLDFIKVEPGTQYTMSYDTSTIFNIYEYDENKNFIQHQQQNNENNSFTITTSATTRFIHLSCGKACIDKIQFEEGSKATKYSDYVDFKNKRKYIMTGQEFQTDEVRNRKVVYGKEIELGNLLNNQTKAVDVIASEYEVVEIKAIVKKQQLTKLISSRDVDVYVENGWLNVTTYADMSDYTATVTLYYVKN